MTNLDSILKSRNITLPTKVCLVKAMVFPVFMDVIVGLWRKLSAEKLMLLNYDVGEDSWESLGLQEIQPVHPKGDQSWVYIGGTDAEAETPVLWPPHAKSWLIRKDPDAGRDWGQEEKGTTEDEMAGWYHRLDVWVNSGSWWWTGRPGMLWFMGSQRVGHDWATELNWYIYTDTYVYICMLLFSHLVILSDSFLTQWTVAYQAPLSMGFARQEYWSGLPFPTLGDLTDLGIKPTTSPELAGEFFTTEPPGKPHKYIYTYIQRERFMLRIWLPQSWRFGKCRILRVGWLRLETQGRLAVGVQRHSAGRIASCSGEVSLCFIKTFSVGVAHPRYGE